MYFAPLFFTLYLYVVARARIEFHTVLALTTTVCLYYIFLLSFRYDFGWDYFSYIKLINYGCQPDTHFTRLTCIMFNLSSSNPQLYFAFTTCIFIPLLIFFFYSFHGARGILIYLFVFMCIPLGMVLTASIIRQSIAIAAFILIARYTYFRFKLRNIFVVFALATLGLESHGTFVYALGCLLIVFVLKRVPVSKFFALSAPVIFYLIGRYGVMNILRVIAPQYTYYSKLDITGMGLFILNCLLYTIITMRFFYTRTNYNSDYNPNDEQFYDCYKLFFVGMCIYTLLYNVNVQAARFAFYFMYFSLPLIVNELLKISTPARYAAASCLLAVFAGQIYVATNVGNNGGRDSITQYELRLQAVRSIRLPLRIGTTPELAIASTKNVCLCESMKNNV